MKNVLHYVRVSTEEQGKFGFSIDHQKEVLELYSKSQGHNVLAVYEDNFSAKDFDRPEWSNMINFIKSNKKLVDELVVLRWDRFSRNATHSYNVIQELNSYGVKINCVEQPLDPSNPYQKVMLGVYLTMPEVENDLIAQRTKDGMNKASREGCWMGSAPKGFDLFRNDNDKATLIPNEYSKYIIEAFELFEQGKYNIPELSSYLKEKGFELSKNSLANILKNPVYIGKVRVKNLEGGYDYFEGLHQGLISEELFNEVQCILEGRNNRKSKTRQISNGDKYPLRGALKCPKCDSNLTSSTSKGRSKRYSYYHCTSSCGTRFKVELAHEKLEILLRELSFKPEVLELYKEIVKEEFEEQEGRTEDKLDRVNKDIKELELKRQKLDDRFLDESIKQEDYDRMLKSINIRLNQLTKEKAQLAARDSNLMEYLDLGVSALHDLEWFYNQLSLEQKKELLGSMFPEKLVFEEDNYRTAKHNDLIALLCDMERDFEALKTEKADISASSSKKAPSMIFNSNQIEEDLKVFARLARSLPEHHLRGYA